MSDEARLKATVFVGGVAQQVDSKALHDAFVPFGEIAEVSLPRPDGRSGGHGGGGGGADVHRGFGYIEFATAADAAEAVDNMEGSTLFGRTLKVAPAKPSQAAHLRGSGAGGPSTARDGTLGARTALWEQEGYLAQRGGAGGEDEGGIAGDGDGGAPQGATDGLVGLDVAGPRADGP